MAVGSRISETREKSLDAAVAYRQAAGNDLMLRIIGDHYA